MILVSYFEYNPASIPKSFHDPTPSANAITLDEIKSES